jgi:Na+-driven multidrug efflux pump
MHNRDVMALSWPILADMLLRSLASYVSIIIFGGNSEAALAATSVCLQITYLLIVIHMVTGTGLTTVLSHV